MLMRLTTLNFNPNCEGGFPGTFGLREDMGADHLQALENWLQVGGYSYRSQRRWRIWRLNPRAGEGLCPDGNKDQIYDNEYRPGQRINVSIWDVTEKEFRKPGQELRMSPGDKKWSSRDKKRNNKCKVFQEFQASRARALVPIAKPASPECLPSPFTPGEDTMVDVHLETPKAHSDPATSSSSASAVSYS